MSHYLRELFLFHELRCYKGSTCPELKAPEKYQIKDEHRLIHSYLKAWQRFSHEKAVLPYPRILAFLPLEMKLSRDESSQRSLLVDTLAFATGVYSTQIPTEFLHGFHPPPKGCYPYTEPLFLCLDKNYELHHPTFK